MIRGKESVKRSKRVIFTSFCIICQSIRAQGVAIKFRAVVKPIIKLLMDEDINIIQMPCPELRYDGVIRNAVRKDAYDNPEFRAICKECAEQVMHMIRILREGKFQIIGILGIEKLPYMRSELCIQEGKRTCA